MFAVALLLALGVLAEISAWIVGPSRALLDTAHDGILPPSFKKVNKHGVSVQTVVIQAAIVTVWDAVLCGSIALSGGSSSSVGYLTAIGLTVVIYLVGYVLFFLGYFVLVFTKKSLQRSFQLPGGTPFKAVVAGVGLVMTVATLVISFFPSSELDAQSNMAYQLTLAIAFVVSMAIPFVIYANRHRWSAAGAAPHAGAASAAGTAPRAGASGSGHAGATGAASGSAPSGAEPTMRGAGGAARGPQPTGARGLKRDVTGLGGFTAAVASATRRPAAPPQDAADASARPARPLRGEGGPARPSSDMRDAADSERPSYPAHQARPVRRAPQAHDDQGR